MWCSVDPVAIDIASADLCNQQTPIVNSAISETECNHHDHHHKNDHFVHIHPESNWRVRTEHGQAIGLGSQQYELITIK